MRSYQFPANFEPDEEGGFVIMFPDIPEAITQGETVEECIEQASDALEEAIIGRINQMEEIPVPSHVRRGQYLITVPAQTAMKAALYEEITGEGLSKVDVAAKLGVDEKEVRRLLDPHHPSKFPRIAEILERAGKRIVISVEDEKEIAVCV